MRKGLVHIYTGEGKGKTTAAIGLAIRARACGLRVLFLQFMKSRSESNEGSFLKSFSIEFVRFKDQVSPLFDNSMKKDDIKKSTKDAVEFARYKIKSGDYDLIVLDEFNSLFRNKLLTIEDAKRLILERPADVELVLTGRDAPEELFELADYVTEMKKIKHPFSRGVKARKGIEF